MFNRDDSSDNLDYDDEEKRLLTREELTKRTIMNVCIFYKKIYI